MKSRPYAQLTLKNLLKFVSGYDKITLYYISGFIMKKRAIPLLLAAFAAACLAGGCGSGESGSIIILDGKNEQTKKTALTVYGHRTDRYSLSVIESALQGYMSAYSADVSYEGAADAYYWNALDTRYKTDNLDDVFMTDRDRLLTMQDSLADLTDAVNADAYNEFTRSQLYSADGKIYAAPTGISTYGLYVNYDLLQKHGQSVPRNLSEFTAVCDYFVKNGVAPLVCNNYSSLSSLILARGLHETYARSDTADEIEKFNANPSALAAPLSDGVDLVYSMIESNWIDLTEAAGTQSLCDDLSLFARGDRPFMITGGWASATLRRILKREGKSLSYGIHAYPVLESSSVLVAQADSLISVKKGENERAAKQLVSALTSPAVLLGLSENQSRFTALGGHTQIDSDSAIIPSASYLVKGKYVVGSDRNLAVPLDSMLGECGTLILGGSSADAVKARLLGLLKGAAV